MVQCLCCSTSLQKLDESLVGEIKAHLFFFRHKSLIALLFYLMHSGQQYNANSQERSLCLKATSLYFILLSVPGSSAFSIFHPVLFAKAMETFKLAIKLHLVKIFSNSSILTLITEFMCFASHYHLWRGLDFYPNSNVTTGNQTHVGSVASL